MVRRKHSRLEKDIRRHIEDSSKDFPSRLEKSRDRENTDRIGVIKYFHPRYLKKFLGNPQIIISKEAGFTWGDGVYVTPLQYPKSSMLYGRIGVLGWYNTSNKRAYNAITSRGIWLYQEWITHQITLYRQLTTTIHSEIVNRTLRNLFKQKFKIEVVYFRPDEEGYHADGMRYTNKDDIWLAITDDFAKEDNEKPSFSSKVEDCRWVSVLMNEFDREYKGTKPLHEALISSNKKWSPAWPVWFNNDNDLIERYLAAYEEAK